MNGRRDRRPGARDRRGRRSTSATSSIILEGEAAAAVGNGHNEAVSASRRLPVPPPPPPPARGGASLAHDDADEGDATTRAKQQRGGRREPGAGGAPPRAGRMPPPPPPPRRTPLGTAALESLDEDGGAGPSSRAAAPSEIDAGSEETGAQGGGGLFEHGPTRATIGDDDDDEGEAFKDAPVTGSRAPRATSRQLPSSRRRGPRAAGPRARRQRPHVDARAQRPNAGATDTNSDARVAEALDKLLADSSISAIFLRGPEPTLVERHGKSRDVQRLVRQSERGRRRGLAAGDHGDPAAAAARQPGRRRAARRRHAHRGRLPPAAPAGVCAVDPQAGAADRTLGELNPGGITPSEVQVVLEGAVKGVRNVLVTGDSAAVSVGAGRARLGDLQPSVAWFRWEAAWAARAPGGPSSRRAPTCPAWSGWRQRSAPITC